MSPPRAPRKISIAFVRALGASVRARRIHLGMTGVDLARRTRMSETAISHIEEGARDLDLMELVSLAEALELPLRTLLRRAERQVEWARKRGKRRGMARHAKGDASR